jgi:hypothetical protein
MKMEREIRQFSTGDFSQLSKNMADVIYVLLRKKKAGPQLAAQPF